MIVILRTLKSAIVALKSKRKRTFLSILGVIIGVITIVIILSICDSVNAYIVGEYNKVGDNLVWLSKEDKSAFDNNVNLDTMNQIGDCDFTDKISPYMIFNAGLNIDSNIKEVSIVGVNEQYKLMRKLDVTGRFFNETEVNSNMRVCVISEGIQKKYLNKQINPIGQSVKINGELFQIIGCVNKVQKSSTGLNEDEVIYLPYTDCINYFNQSNMNMIMFTINDSSQINNDISYLKNTFANKNIQITSVNDYINQLKIILNLARAIAILFTVVSLIVSGIGIMNVMLMSIEERKLEIGLRKAIGANNNIILLQFLFESIIICFLGIFIGLAISIYCLILVSFIMKVSIEISKGAVFISVGFCLLLGLLFGIGPANKAAALEPVECLEER